MHLHLLHQWTCVEVEAIKSTNIIRNNMNTLYRNHRIVNEAACEEERKG